MKERPMLFDARSVPGIFDGRITMTRRVLKPQPSCMALGGGAWYPYEDSKRKKHYANVGHFRKGVAADFCPYGQIGDRLWVREACYIWGRWRENGLTKTGKQAWTFKAETPHTVIFAPSHPQVATKTTPRETCAYWKRPSIFMPHWASRILLEITDIRVERVQEISGENCVQEGATTLTDLNMVLSRIDKTPFHEQNNRKARAIFQDLWDSINAKRGFGWDVNPWVWVIEFKEAADAVL